MDSQKNEKLLDVFIFNHKQIYNKYIQVQRPLRLVPQYGLMKKRLVRKSNVISSILTPLICENKTKFGRLEWLMLSKGN